MKSLTCKTIRIVVMALFFSSSIVMASPSSPVMRITGLGGVNAAIVRIDPPQDFKMIPDFGLLAGGLITADFIEYIKFDTGFMYKQTRFNILNSSVSATNIFYEQYFVPVTARFELKFLSVGAGFFYATQVKEKFTEVDYGIRKGTTLTTFNKKGIRSNNFGFMGTLGLRFKLPTLPVGFMVDLWYLHGLNEVYMNNSSNSSSNNPSIFSLKQSDAQLLFGISLYL